MIERYDPQTDELIEVTQEYFDELEKKYRALVKLNKEIIDRNSLKAK